MSIEILESGSMMITGQDTQVFAINSLLTQWSLKLHKGVEMRPGVNYGESILNHMKSMFKEVQGFDDIDPKSKEMYNSIIYTLEDVGMISKGRYKEA